MIACETPVSFETMVALSAGELDADAEEATELHLFGCDACATTSEHLATLIDAIRHVIPPVVSHAHRDRLAAAGMKILVTPVDAGVDARAVFAADLDLLVHVLRGDLARADRVDVELVDEHGVTRFELVHVPFDRAAGEVLIACQRHFEHFPFLPRFVVHAVEAGVRRRVGSYWIDHVWHG